MQPPKIRPKHENVSFLIPLFCKAFESQRHNSILSDPKAEEIIRQIDYDFDHLEIPKQSLVTLAMRAKKLDSYVRDYLKRAVNPLVLHLGCGLDSRVLRLAPHRAAWYDLDLPEVIKLRRKFYTESERYHMIASSVTDHTWMERVKEEGAACVIAEGLLMYLHENEVRELFASLQARFPGSRISFDVYSRDTAEYARNQPSVKKSGVQIHWYIDDARRIESWGRGMRLLEEWFFTDSDDIATLGVWFREFFPTIEAFEAVSQGHRLLHIQL